MTPIRIELLNGEFINVALYEEYAPITTANFLHLVDIGFYNGLIFHRIIKGFMSQGGHFYIEDNNLYEKNNGYAIPGEFNENGFENKILHTAGVISMARTDDPNSAGSQFFICDQDCGFLNNKYAAFGIVLDDESMNVVHKLSSVPTTTVLGMDDFPNCDVRDITIKSIIRLKNPQLQ